MRKTKRLEGALPWLYLKGVSSGEMGAALEVLVGPQAKGLYLDEFMYRFNRRWWEPQLPNRLISLCLQHSPIGLRATGS